MKRIIVLAIAALHLGAGLALAAPFGPAEPQTRPGQVSLGVGVFEFADRWDFRIDNLGTEEADVRQTHSFAQLSVGLFPQIEGYARLGMANLRGDLRDTGFAPYGTLGLKGIGYRGKYLDVGGFVEGSYFSDYTAEEDGLRIEIDNSYTINAGVAFQREVEGALLYAGPFWHYRNGDFTSNDPDLSGSYRAGKNFGGFAGIRWTPVYDILIEAEIQYRDKLAGGVTISFLFGRH